MSTIKEDKRIWLGTKNGLYIIKNAYLLIMLKFIQHESLIVTRD